ncbi:FAD/NAD(P)-binding protein [Paenibacillus ihbetae]|nr:FAD/NAD(P)-binding protein [Paenibacillus ihbetae]
MRVALVGGGPAAVCMMESLIRVRDLLNPYAYLDVTVFDPSPNPWCGPNYAPDMPEALTNVYTSDMSVRYWDTEHVADWLKANGYAHFVGTMFAPRAIIGKYFQDSAKKSIACMNAFEYIREQATKVTLSDCVAVETPTRNYKFDYVVLCTGGATSSDPYGLQGQDNFFSTPYPLKETLNSIGAEERVGIIGSGLSAVDLTLGLIAKNHRGPITLMSRRGLLPSVRRPPVKYSLQYFTVKGVEDIVAAKGSLSIRDLIKLTYRELDHAGASKQEIIDEVLSERYGIDRLRHQMARLDDGEIADQLCIKILATACEDAWYFLSCAEKKYLYSNFRHIVYSLCCPMPKHRAAQILRLADSGQLSILRGLRSVSKDEQGHFVAFAEGNSIIRFDRVFSAISGENRPSPMALPIIEGLLKTGQASPHPLGGLNVERTTSRLIDAHNRPQTRLYALGNTVSGALYIFNGVFLLARRSAHVAQSILEYQKNTETARHSPRSIYA